MKGNFGRFCRFFENHPCSENYCEDCQLYRNYVNGLDAKGKVRAEIEIKRQIEETIQGVLIS